jgi:hypothetical protein
MDKVYINLVLTLIVKKSMIECARRGVEVWRATPTRKVVRSSPRSSINFSNPFTSQCLSFNQTIPQNTVMNLEQTHWLSLQPSTLYLWLEITKSIT